MLRALVTAAFLFTVISTVPAQTPRRDLRQGVASRGPQVAEPARGGACE